MRILYRHLTHFIKTFNKSDVLTSNQTCLSGNTGLSSEFMS